MQIAPATYKKMPLKSQFDHMAADYRRGNAAHKAAGKRRVDVIPPVLLDTGARAGMSAGEIKKALGVSNGTLWRALKNAGISLSKMRAERRARKKADIAFENTSAEEGADASTDRPLLRLPDAQGIVSAWLANDFSEQPSLVVQAAVERQVTKANGDQSKIKLKAPFLAEAVAKRMIGEAADSQIAGTYTGRDGEERCDGLVGKGPTARPTIYAWREKATEIEEILRLCREIQTESAAQANPTKS